ncbi:hypothetical protein GP486_001427 [Trichoglossum hirsutum]|uniref:Uncharacterized protein n=1 Tax=Trichoglossum hirsutum TaxID=265104 RepID=A0A9P8LGV9_9PEZI|nr:hypothetical protein GP486_001427 [Trichoglossum hirsutum]
MLHVRDPLAARRIVTRKSHYLRFLDKKSLRAIDREKPRPENERREDERIRGEILRPFNVPDFLKSDTSTDLNGYFGSKGTYDAAGKLESYSTWFRCLVKMMLKADELTASGKNYKWHEMGIFTRWDRVGSCKVLCVDTPREMASGLEEALAGSTPDLKDPFAMHAPLIDQIVKLYDDSVWAIRHPIREIEKTRQAAVPHFLEMHEISRHGTHISEIISVTIETMENLLRQQKAIYEKLDVLEKSYREQAQEYTRFQLQMIKSLGHRSCSNNERLKSETTLVMKSLP